GHDQDGDRQRDHDGQRPPSAHRTTVRTRPATRASGDIRHFLPLVCQHHQDFPALSGGTPMALSRGTRILVAEALGTMILILGGPGAVVIGKTIDLPVGTLGVALAFGLSLLCAAYFIGSISGCHINPAVTIGLWAMKKTESKLVAFYIIGQIVGALVGAGILALILSTGDYNVESKLSRQDLFT